MNSLTRILCGGLFSIACLLTLSGCPRNSLEKFAPGPEDPDAPTEYTTTESGLKYRILRKGEGRPAEEGDETVVQMRGSLEDGYIFDTTYHDGHDMHLPLSAGLIPGVREGLKLVGNGGMIELLVPPELGYGKNGHAGVIPPNATLTFLIEVKQINRAPEEKPRRQRADAPLEPAADMPEEWSTTESGIKYRMRVTTDRLKPEILDTVTLMHRIRYNDAEGEIFTDTYHRGHGRYGAVNVLIPAIAEMVTKCPVMGSIEFILPPELAGDRDLQWMPIPNEGKETLPEGVPMHFIIEVTGIQYKDF